jgi:riboflavin kinase/FMN adenylyltransferase
MTTFPVVQGKVMAGNQLGRTIGFPTANLDINPDNLDLKPGVYVGTCEVNNAKYLCLPYFGPRSVVGETKNCFEVYIYDFDQDIYGQVITVQPQHFIRPPLKIETVEELKLQLESDKKTGLKMVQ